MYILASMNSN